MMENLITVGKMKKLHGRSKRASMVLFTLLIRKRVHAIKTVA